MIRDFGDFEHTVDFPTAGVFAASGAGWDMNPDFGTGQSARKSPLITQGETLLIHVKVSTAFVVANGTPIAQIHVALSDTGAVGGTAMHAGDDFLVIGTVAPSEHTVGGRDSMGLVAAQLTTTDEYFIAVNPWVATMGRNRAGGTVLGKDLRYMGLALTVSNFDVGGNTGFSAGTITGRVVKEGDIHKDPADFIYPAGTVVAG